MQLDKYFKVTDVYKWNEFNIDDKYLYFIVDDYFDFPHVTREMDLTFCVPIPFAELDKYLKNDSILKRLAIK